MTASLYDITITTVEGDTIKLSKYRDKKILLAVLPVNETEANLEFLHKLDSVGKARPEIVIIGILSREDGVTSANLKALKQWYRKYLAQGIVLTEIINSRKASGNQHPLLSWLTNKDMNAHFDNDCEGAGQLYFVNEAGELKAVMSPGISLSGKTLTKLLQ